MKQFVIVLLGLFFLSIGVHEVTAQTATPTCVPVFGGGPSCQRTDAVVVNKQIRDPRSGKYVDRLSTPFAAGDTVTFHIFVTNVTNNDLSGILIQDNFPAYLTYVSGDGKFDTNKQVFTANLTTLAKGQSKAITVTGTVVSADKIPSAPSPVCIGNLATATHNGKTSNDTTPFCVSKTAQSVQGTTTNTNQPSTRNVKPGNTTKGGLPINQPPANTRKTPETGPMEIAYLAIAASTFGGIYLRRKAIK